jgi:hypothetical protein
MNDLILGILIVLPILILLLAAVIYWVGNEIVYELRYRNFLLKEDKNEHE